MPIVRRKLGIVARALAAAAAVAATLAWWLPPLRAPERVSTPTPPSQATSQTPSPSAAEESGTQATEGRTQRPAAPPIAARDPSRYGPSRRPAPRPSTPSGVASPEAPQPPHPVPPQPRPAKAPGAGQPSAAPSARPVEGGPTTIPSGVQPPDQSTALPPLAPEAGAPANRAPEPVITPPVPVALTAPRHPLPYQMIVEAPGIASGARLKGVEARVRLRLLVRADGTVGRTEIAVPSGRPELDGAALEAALGWRFLPARRDGDPIESIVLIWVAFTSGP